MDLPLSTPDLLELKKIQRNVVGVDASTAYRYLNTYTSSGIDPLLGTGHKGYWGMLDSHQLSALREELNWSSPL